LTENFVFLQLRRRGYEVFYFEKKQEVDFYARHESGEAVLINVVWEMTRRDINVNPKLTHRDNPKLTHP